MSKSKPLSAQSLLTQLRALAADYQAGKQIDKQTSPAGAGDPPLSDVDVSRIIEMAWEDRTPFDAIEHNYGLNEPQVIELMRLQLKGASFRLWRRRVTGRKTKHRALRSPEVSRAYCPTQYKRS